MPNYQQSKNIIWKSFIVLYIVCNHNSVWGVVFGECLVVPPKAKHSTHSPAPKKSSEPPKESHIHNTILNTLSITNKTRKPGYAGPKFQSPYPHIKGKATYCCLHKSVWLFAICQGHQRPGNDTRHMSVIQHSCLRFVRQLYSLWTVKLWLRTAMFWLKKVDFQ